MREGVADLSFFLELRLEAAEDGGVEEAGWVRHGGLECDGESLLMAVVVGREFLEAMIIGERRGGHHPMRGDLATW